jgi:hypothetical protein
VEGQAAKVVLVCTGVNLSDIERCKAGIVYAFRVGIPVVLVEFTAAYVCVCFAYFMVGHHGNRGENGGSLLCCLEGIFFCDHEKRPPRRGSSQLRLWGFDMCLCSSSSST